MAEAIEDVLFATGDVLFDTETPLSTAYFILEGAVDLTLTLGHKTVEVSIGANQFVGDAAVAVGQKPHAESIAYHGRAIAREPVRAVAIPIEDIRNELEACPPLLRAWIASFVNRVLIIVEKLSVGV